MKPLWLLLLPLLYLPNLGLEVPTSFGTLTLTDFLIGLYVLLIFHSSRKNKSETKLLVDALIPLMAGFVWWAVISTLLIPFRYGYPNYIPVYFGLLKLGKLAVYGVAGILTMRALSMQGNRDSSKFQWIILFVASLIGGILLITQNVLPDNLPTSLKSGRGIYPENSGSLMLGILITFLLGKLLVGQETRQWRRYSTLGLIIMLLGFVFVQGRGGWVAVIGGMLYLFSKIDFRRTIIVATFGALLILLAYNQFPDFRREVDRTLQPDPTYLETYDIGFYGIDDGGRLSILQAEFPKVFDTPLLGRGFFHRGNLSGIFTTGSHNFFLQMFLETGIPGGTLILMIFWRMWRQVASCQGNDNIAIRSALVASFVGGLSGEYFYGGMVLFTLLLVYAPIGSMQVCPVVQLNSAVHGNPAAR